MMKYCTPSQDGTAVCAGGNHYLTICGAKKREWGWCFYTNTEVMHINFEALNNSPACQTEYSGG